MRKIKALLVIDVQKGYIEQYDAELLPAMNSRIIEAVKNNELIIYVKNVRHLKSGTSVYEFVDGLEVCSSHIVYKEKASVFENQELLSLLRENDIAEIEVIGIDGCCCVASSAAAAKALGFQVTMPCAYIGIKQSERFKKKKVLLQKQGICITE